MWHVYLLLCGDDTLYAGVTTDLARRLAAHQTGKGARYTRSRGAVGFVHTEPAVDRGAALRREWALKQLSRADKLSLLRSSVRGERRRRVGLLRAGVGS